MRLWQRTVERDGLRTDVWLVDPEYWSRCRYVMETAGHRTTMIREPKDGDIDQHREGFRP